MNVQTHATGHVDPPPPPNSPPDLPPAPPPPAKRLTGFARLTPDERRTMARRSHQRFDVPADRVIKDGVRKPMGWRDTLETVLDEAGVKRVVCVRLTGAGILLRLKGKSSSSARSVGYAIAYQSAGAPLFPPPAHQATAQPRPAKVKKEIEFRPPARRKGGA
jgi:hypothetical protein